VRLKKISIEGGKKLIEICRATGNVHHAALGVPVIGTKFISKIAIIF
jgi:hypothetical protein